MKLLLKICLTLVLLVPIAPTNPVRADVLAVRPPGGGNVGILGDVYPTIQAAIDAASPGDTILVHAGTYNEQIVVNKALTLQGDGRDVTTIDGSSGSGASVTVVYITAPGDVTFDGFTVQNAPIVNVDDLRFGILTNSSVSGVTYTISNNKVIGTNNVDAEEDYGIYGRSNGKENLIITNNIVTQTGANNIVVECHQGTTDISWNNLDAGCYGTDPVFVMTLSGVNVSSLQKVSHNNIDMSTGTGRATGVSFATGVTTGVGGQFTNVQITDNSITNLKPNRRGVGFWNNSGGDGSAGNIIAPLVSGNTITGTAGDMGMDTIGLVTDANFSRNTVTGLAYSFKERVWNGHIATGTLLNLNCFTNNSGGVLTERTSGTLNAVLNSWGDASGPYHPVTNPGGLGDPVSNNVDYYPWYPDCTFGSPAYKPVHNVNINAYYDNIKPAVAAAGSGNLITVEPVTLVESGQIVIDKNLTIKGIGSGKPTIKTNQNTGTSGNPRGWWLVNAGVELNLQDMILDGSGYNVHQGIRILGHGTINNVDFKNIVYPPPVYAGLAVAAMGDSTVDVNGCTFENIGRVGVIYFGSGVNGSVYSNNTYTGKGPGDWLDYAVELGGGAVAEIKDSTITDCNGIAASDGSTSAGILVTTYYGAGTTATVTHNVLSENSSGIAVGYDSSDTSVVVARCNSIAGNIDYGIVAIEDAAGLNVDSKYNWWGSSTGPSGEGGGSGDKVSANVDFFPWLLSIDGCDDYTQVAPDYVVDDDWAGLPDWTTVTVGGVDYYIGLNAFDTIQKSIAAASDGNNISIQSGTYCEVGQIVINKNLQITGADKTSTIIKPNHNTTVGGNVPSEGWIYVPSGISFTLKNVTLDGIGCDDNPRTIHHAVQSRGQLTMENCIVRNIKAGTYYGRGIVLYKGTGNISKCEFYNIQRIGIHVRGNVESPNPVADIYKCVYVGKGDGDWLDYGIEFGGGGSGKVTGSVISDCTGVASTDGSNSAGILVTDYWGTGTEAEVKMTTITDCNVGIAVGYADEDTSKLTANFNKIAGNLAYGVSATAAASVDATYNWWGDMSGPEDIIGTLETDGKNCYDVSLILNADGLGDSVSENVVYCPWLLAPVISSDGPCPVGDLDGDCDVDFLDLAILANNWLVGTE